MWRPTVLLFVLLARPTTQVEFPAPVSVNITSNGTILPARLYLTPELTAQPAIVFMHGSGGLYKNDDPSDVIEKNFRKWANMSQTRGYTALFVDSYTPRGGKSGASEVDVRPYDAFAAIKYLREAPLVSGRIATESISLLGWSHGGSSVMSALASTNPQRAALPILCGVAFYPGCGLYSAFGGISKSTYCPSSPLLILAAGLDPLYTGGYCNTRQNRARMPSVCPNSTVFNMTVFPNAQHSFDEADQAAVASGKFTAADLEAATAADEEAWNFFTSRCGQGMATSTSGRQSSSSTSSSPHTAIPCTTLTIAALVMSVELIRRF